MHERKRAVLYKAQQLFAENGITDTSVQDIIHAANISKGTFYNYFSSKSACIISILELVQDETVAARNELLVGADPSSIEVLAKQVEVRMRTDEKYSLHPIFHAVYHSKDEKLIAFIKTFQQTELTWLTSRFIEIFGKEVEPYAADCAVMYYGLLQYLIAAWMSNSNDYPDITAITNYSTRRLSAIVADVIKQDDRLLEEHIFLYPKEKRTANLLSRKDIIEQLEEFKQTTKNISQRKRQFIEFLIEEFQREEPRGSILESIIHSFRKEFDDTFYESSAQHISAHVWRYIQHINT
ncbi:MAG TPA: TetR/AcrR family transcriptional regulator [Bacillota bacterium]|nr:TetR/AcrR family transcriptional regulator [Bacillota bacterium]